MPLYKLYFAFNVSIIKHTLSVVPVHQPKRLRMRPNRLQPRISRLPWQEIHLAACRISREKPRHTRVPRIPPPTRRRPLSEERGPLVDGSEEQVARRRRPCRQRHPVTRFPSQSEQRGDLARCRQARVGEQRVREG